MERSRREREFHEFSLELLGFIWDFSALSRPQAPLPGEKLDFNWIYLGFGGNLGENPFQEWKFRPGIPALGFGGFLVLIWAFLLLILGVFIPHFWGFHS